jgi:hypothetical protein
VPVGFHLAGAGGEGVPLAGAAAVLDALRSELDGALFVSAALERGRLGEEEAVALAEAVDFLVVPLYGQTMEGAAVGEGDPAWDLDAVEAGARAAAALGRPFFAGVGALGSAVAIDPAGRPAFATTEVSIQRLATDRALTLGRSHVLRSGRRQLTVFEAERATRLAGREVAAGQVIQAIRPGPDDLLAVTRGLAGAGFERYLGPLFVRLAGPGEGLSYPAAALAAVARGEEPPPGLEVAVAREEQGPERTVLRVTLANRGLLPTGVALLENNYAELKLRGGVFATIEPGGFRRYALEIAGREAATMRERQEADTVKLFYPALDPGAAVTSGPIAVRSADGGEPRIDAGGRFLLAGGSLYDVPAVAAAAAAAPE